MQSVTVELQVVASTGVDGKVGFRVPVVDEESGGSVSPQEETTNTVTVVFGSPVASISSPEASIGSPVVADDFSEAGATRSMSDGGRDGSY